MSTERKTEQVPEWKQAEVDELVELIDSYDSVGVVSIAGIPARQLQDMRRDLHGSAEIRVSRNTLLRRAVEAADLEELDEHLAGHVGLIGTNDNPFALYRDLESSKTPAPIGAGEVAPNDITIPEGDTGVDDGQFIGDLKQVGVDSRFQDGSVAVLEETVALEAGGEVSQQLANVLSTLGIEPKEVGLDLRAVVSDGVLFGPEDLAIDYEEYRQDVEAAAAAARNLSVNAGVPTARTTGQILSKAASDARAVGIEAAIADEDLVDDLLSQADRRLRALAARIDDEEALPEELRGVEAPEPQADADPEPDDEDGEEDEDEHEAEAEDDDDEDDDDDADAAEGLGDMFG